VNTGGGAHSLAVTSTGRVYAGGWNGVGQLGDGTTTNRSSPTLITFAALQTGETIQSVNAGGGAHSLAVTSTGRVYAWGLNEQGQLGDGTTTNRSTPTLITFTGLQTGETIQNVDAGQLHSLAITTTGSVYTWGLNEHGQLGYGTTTNRSSPTRRTSFGLTFRETIQSVSAGQVNSLAITTTGRVFAWGWNGSGQLGDGTTTNRLWPLHLNVYTNHSLVWSYVKYDEEIYLPTPSLDGYEFIGWYMDSAFTIPYNLTTMPANNISLYALFTSTNN
jgi:uncharacterized repeat protein (TIGR02543 family)